MADPRQSPRQAEARQPEQEQSEKERSEKERQDALIDEASRESMDGSDPPAYNPGTPGAGRNRRSTPSREPGPPGTEAEQVERRVKEHKERIWKEAKRKRG